MAQYKVIKEIKNANGVIPVGTLVNGTKRSGTTTVGGVKKNDVLISVVYKGKAYNVKPEDNKLQLVSESNVTVPGNNTHSTQENLNQSSFGKKARTTQLVFIAGGWALIYYIYKKKWNKSNGWKAGILIATAYNAYSTYKTLSSPAIQVTTTKK
jgi:hypothetical protein